MSYSDADRPIPHWVRTLDGIAFTDIPIRPAENLPEFMIIGAAKAGTTALNQYLSQHPQIFMCPLKEPQFFSTDVIYERGLDWYQGLFSEAKPGQICGEASTSYTFFPSTPLTPQRIHQALANIKLIYMVREPVSRVESACLQTIKYQKYVLNDHNQNYSVDQLIQFGEDTYNPLGLPSFIQSSQYITQIEQYLKFFKSEQLLVIFQEDLAQNPDRLLREIFAFIGVDPMLFPELKTPNQANVSADMVQGLKEEKLGKMLQVIPGYGRFKNWVPDRLKNSLKQLNQQWTADDQVITFMSEETNARLKEHFKPYNQALAKFLNRDLSHWD
jgi:hypothetical protein